VTYRPHPDAKPETELSALVAVYRYVLSTRGEQHDLTNDSTAEMAKNGPQKSEREKT
jgi:hypothetical protein